MQLASSSARVSVGLVSSGGGSVVLQLEVKSKNVIKYKNLKEIFFFIIVPLCIYYIKIVWENEYRINEKLGKKKTSLVLSEGVTIVPEKNITTSN